MKYIVLEPHKTEFPNPIFVKQDEKVIIEIEHDEEYPNWFYIKKTDDTNSGWIPEQIITKMDGNVGIVSEDYSANELSVDKGSILIGFKELNGWLWCKPENSNEIGWVPLKNIKLSIKM